MPSDTASKRAAEILERQRGGPRTGASPSRNEQVLAEEIDKLVSEIASDALDMHVAFVRDRAAQYESDSGIRSALEELAVKLAQGEAEAAAGHGELDDLMPGGKMTYTIWRLMVGKDGHGSIAADIAIPNDRPRAESITRATARFYAKLEDETLDAYFDGMPEEWIIREARVIAEEAYL